MHRLTWRKSSYTDNGSCVELAEDGDTIAVRNSNHPDAGTLHFPTAAWSAFLAEVKSGALD